LVAAAFQGERFGDPSAIYGHAIVTSVDREHCEITIDQLEAKGESHAPSPGWKFSTRADYNPDCKDELQRKAK
jgi:hypothetical protein